MSDGEVRTERKGDVVFVTFDRPAAPAMPTWQMYEQLNDICTKLKSDTGVRVVVFRGAGGKSFSIAGTDIAQFKSFIQTKTPSPTRRRWSALSLRPRSVADADALHGRGLPRSAVGSPSRLLRHPYRDAGFTVRHSDRAHAGQLLSLANYARLVASIGMARTKKMLLLAERPHRRGGAGRRIYR